MYNCLHSNQLFHCLFSTATDHFPTLYVNINSYSLQDSPSLWNPSSCLQITPASLLPKKVSQIVPQALSMQISTLPSLVPACTSSPPPSSLSSPWLQFQFWVEVAVRRIVLIWHATTEVLSSNEVACIYQHKQQKWGKQAILHTHTHTHTHIHLKIVCINGGDIFLGAYGTAVKLYTRCTK